MEVIHEFDESAHIKEKGLPILIALLDELNKSDCIAGIFGEQLLRYHTGIDPSKLNENLYEMFVFYDHTSVYSHDAMVYDIDRDDTAVGNSGMEENMHAMRVIPPPPDYKTISSHYKSDLFGFIWSGFQALCDALNEESSAGGTSGRQTYALRQDTMLESKWNYFTSSITVEIYRESDNMNVFYCEFGQIRSVIDFKRRFSYQKILPSMAPTVEEVLISYFLNFDGFVFTFFFTMNKLKFTKGILFFQQCQQSIKDAVLRLHSHHAQQYLIGLFLDTYKLIFNIFIPVAIQIPDRPLMYMKIYESSQAEILHELFLLFDAKIVGVGSLLYREKSYKGFCSELNQDLLKTIGDHLVFLNGCTGTGILSIYQILAYYTNALNECMEDYGCIAQESGGDASTHYMSEAEASKVYISDVDIKFFFDSGRSEGDVGYNVVPRGHKEKILYSLHWLIHFFNEHGYLKMNEEITTIRFGGENFDFSIDSMKQRKRFRIRALEQWKDIAGLFSLDARLKIKFVRGGDELSGKIDMAFFDIACIDVATKVDRGHHKSVSLFKNKTSLSHSKLLEIWRGMEMPAVPQDYDFPGVYRTESDEFRLMPIPSLKNALLESIELTGEERMAQRMAVGKHEKDVFRKRQFMKLFVYLLNSKVGYNIGNGNVSDETLNEIDDNKLLEYLNGSGTWFSRGNNFRFKQLPVEQLVQICRLEQVDIETRFDNLADIQGFRVRKDDVINNLRMIFNGSMVPGGLSNMTAEFIQNLETSSSHRYKLSYSYAFQKDDLHLKSDQTDQTIETATVGEKKRSKKSKKGGKYTRKPKRKNNKTRRI
jgi:hypothetical protein